MKSYAQTAAASFGSARALAWRSTERWIVRPVRKLYLDRWQVGRVRAATVVCPYAAQAVAGSGFQIVGKTLLSLGLQ